eukprot:scaffold58756_cov55-Phaeocystis_antarctica.AAC.2
MHHPAPARRPTLAHSSSPPPPPRTGELDERGLQQGGLLDAHLCRGLPAAELPRQLPQRSARYVETPPRVTAPRAAWRIQGPGAAPTRPRRSPRRPRGLPWPHELAAARPEGQGPPHLHGPPSLPPPSPSLPLPSPPLPFTAACVATTASATATAAPPSAFAASVDAAVGPNPAPYRPARPARRQRAHLRRRAAVPHDQVRAPGEPRALCVAPWDAPGASWMPRRTWSL